MYQQKHAISQKLWSASIKIATELEGFVWEGDGDPLSEKAPQWVRNTEIGKGGGRGKGRSV
jgi:hypothetical protein